MGHCGGNRDINNELGGTSAQENTKTRKASIIEVHILPRGGFRSDVFNTDAERGSGGILLQPAMSCTIGQFNVSDRPGSSVIPN